MSTPISVYEDRKMITCVVGFFSPFFEGRIEASTSKKRFLCTKTKIMQNGAQLPRFRQRCLLFADPGLKNGTIIEWIDGADYE